WVASAGADGMFKLWDAETRSEIACWKDEDLQSTAPKVGASRQPNDTEMRVRLQQELYPLMGMYDVPQTTLVFDRENARVIAAGRDNVIRLWGLTGSKLLAGHAKRVNALALDDSGKHLASGSEDGVVIIWDLQTQRPVQTTSLQRLRNPDPSN